MKLVFFRFAKRLAILISIQQLRKKYIAFCNCLEISLLLTSQAEHPNLFIHVLI